MTNIKKGTKYGTECNLFRIVRVETLKQVAEKIVVEEVWHSYFSVFEPTVLNFDFQWALLQIYDLFLVFVLHLRSL